MPPLANPLVLAAAALLGVSACATSRVDPDRQVRMEPVMVRANPDPTVGLETYDAETLFDLGAEAYQAERWEVAARVFEKLVAEFPEASEVPAALYNAGLSREHLEHWPQAVAAFEAILRDHQGSEVYPDAHFNLARAYGKVERWEEVADTFWAARQLEGLSPMDEIEARVGTGVGFFMQGDPYTAEREFLRALRFYEEHPQRQYLPAKYFVAQSRFYLGEILAREFEAVELSVPEAVPEGADWTEMMGAELEKKCDLLLRAQARFIRTIREGHRGWATAAGFRIGSMYERLFDEMMAVPVPPELDEGAAEVYREELRERVSVLVRKAIRVYEANREMAERVGEDNEWVERTSAALERMKKLYLATAS